MKTFISVGKVELIYHINASVLSIVDLVVPYNRAAVGSDLDPRQGVTIDIVILYQTPTITKYVHPSLVTIEYGISPRYKIIFLELICRLRQDDS